jgi:hypothetical protein
MNRRRRRFVLMLLPALAATAWWSVVWWNERSALHTALEWARLAPLPRDAENVELQVRGGMFTRTFEVTFTTSERGRDNWLKLSPGIRDAEKTRVEDSTHYEIVPSGGAARAYVRVDENSRVVTIFSQWS